MTSNMEDTTTDALEAAQLDSSQDEAEPQAAEPGSKPERSRIKFPYTDIDDALLVARTIKNLHGAGPIRLDQLAAALGGASIKSGAFRTKLATAGTFGAIRSTRGQVQLTDLGHRLADDATQSRALVEAFLRVPLYREIYDRYEGKALPADLGLENDIRELGVVASQADRARQALQRSADKAGFFWGGRSHLIAPLDAKVEASAEDSPQAAEVASPAPAQERQEDVLSNPLLAALFKKMLPAEGQEFSAKERQRFFRALAVNLDVVYGEPEDGSIDPQVFAQMFSVTPASKLAL